MDKWQNWCQRGWLSHLFKIVQLVNSRAMLPYPRPQLLIQTFLATTYVMQEGLKVLNIMFCLPWRNLNIQVPKVPNKLTFFGTEWLLFNPVLYITRFPLNYHSSSVLNKTNKQANQQRAKVVRKEEKKIVVYLWTKCFRRSWWKQCFSLWH